MDGRARLFMLILAAPRLVCKTVGAGLAVTVHYGYPAWRRMRYALLRTLLIPETRAVTCSPRLKPGASQATLAATGHVGA